MATQEHKAQLVVRHDIDEGVEVVEFGVRSGSGSMESAWSRAAAVWRISREDSRRIRSMARFRAVVTIHPPGLGGTP